MEKIKGFRNSNILTEEGIKKTNLIIKEDYIYSVSSNDIDGLIELDDKYIVIPGLIDEHIHGTNGVDVIDGNEENIYNIACSLSKEGVTAFLPTTTTQSIEVIDKSLLNVRNYILKNHEEGAQVLGVHLEGPFISDIYKGAQLGNYIIKPDIEIFKHLEKTSGDNIKLVSMAVEEEGSLKFIKYLKDKKIVVSAGHTNATYDEIKTAIENGLTCTTHTYNGMRPYMKDEIGTVGSALLCDELYTELICDGVHVSIPAVKFLYKNKPTNKIVLISDALRTKGMPDGVYKELEQTIILKDKEARLEDGTLAGSVLKLNEAIKNFMDFTKANFEDAVKCATENPAKNLGVFDKMGSIKENKLANLVIVDKELNVYQTIRNGKIIYNRL